MPHILSTIDIIKRSRLSREERRLSFQECVDRGVLARERAARAGKADVRQEYTEIAEMWEAMAERLKRKAAASAG